MFLLRAFALCALVLGSSFASAKDAGFGLNVGVGVPFMTQAGLNYRINDRFGLSAEYNIFDVSIGDAKVSLTMPEVLFHFHPFRGSYFIAAGVGQESFEVKGTSATSLQKVSIKVDAMTSIVKTGWMWGLGNKGFWAGMDVAFISPSGTKETITAPGVPTTDKTYTDAVDAAKKFGKTSYVNFTFLRLGWMF